MTGDGMNTPQTPGLLSRGWNLGLTLGANFHLVALPVAFLFVANLLIARSVSPAMFGIVASHIAVGGLLSILFRGSANFQAFANDGNIRRITYLSQNFFSLSAALFLLCSVVFFVIGHDNYSYLSLIYGIVLSSHTYIYSVIRVTLSVRAFYIYGQALRAIALLLLAAALTVIGEPEEYFSAWTFILPFVLSFVVALYLLRHGFRLFRINFKRPNLREAGAHITSSAALLLSFSIKNFELLFGILFLSAVGLGEIAFNFKLILASNAIFAYIHILYLPKLTKSYIDRDRTAFLENIKKVVAISFAIGAVILGVIFIFEKTMIGIFSDYQNGIIYLKYFYIINIFTFLLGPATAIFLADKKQNIIFLILASSFVVRLLIYYMIDEGTAEVPAALYSYSGSIIFMQFFFLAVFMRNLGRRAAAI